MSYYIYDFISLFTGGIVALSLLFRIYKRSVATFIIFISQLIVINLVIYGCVDEGLFVMIFTMVILLIRAMNKSDDDKFFKRIIHGND